MKSLLLTLAMIVCAAQMLVAQDVIVTRQAARIDAKILEVSETEVKYKKTSNPDGPVFVLSTDSIATIAYYNGEVQVFKEKKKPEQKLQLLNHQVNEDVLLVRKGRKIVNQKDGGKKVPDNLREMLGEEGYRNYKSARVAYGTGSTLAVFGWLSLGAGLVMSFHGGYTLNANESLVGILVAGVADILLPVGYVIRGVNAGRISRIAEAYNADAHRQLGMEMSVAPSLLLAGDGTVAPGVGLSLRF